CRGSTGSGEVVPKLPNSRDPVLPHRGPYYLAGVGTPSAGETGPVPDTRTPRGLILTPGAGASRDHHTLVAVERRLAELDPPLPTERVDFPYRTAGKRMPDRAPVAVAHVRTAAERFAAKLGTTTDALLLGGRSY